MSAVRSEPRGGTLAVADGRSTARVVLRLLRPSAGLALLAVLLLGVGTVAGIATPLAIGALVDEIVAGRDDVLLRIGAALAALAVGQAVAVGLAQVAVARVGEPAVATLRERVLTHALSLPAGRVEEAGTGDVVSRVSRDVRALGDIVRTVLVEFAAAALTLALTVAGLALVDLRLALAALVACPVQVLATRRYLRSAVPAYAEEAVVAARQTQQLLDSIGAADTVVSLGLVERHLASIAARAEAVRAMVIRVTAIRTTFFAGLNLAELIGTCTVLGTAFWLLRADAITAGGATAAALMFIRLFDPINTVLALVDDVQAAGAALTRLVGVLQEPTASGSAVAAGADSSRPVDVRVEAVTYHYPHRDAGAAALTAIDLTVAAGETLAIVGASGAGKSTLAALIAGQRFPDAGRVLLGGVPLDDMAPEQVHEHVVLLSQDAHVFAGTLREDLALVRPDATDAELLDTLARVRAGWVEQLPDGLDTVVGRGGQALTPVQVQQLALARALLRDPAVVVLDEATAEAGSVGGTLLERAAEEVTRGRTAVVIAHRLPQADRCDRVAVMAAGRIVEIGAPAELRTSPGSTYATLWAAWQ